MAKKVLLVDDEWGYIEALEDALISEGYEVFKAATGEEAISILENQRIDLTSIDVMLPPGASLETRTTSQETGLYLAEFINRSFPKMDLFCISVVNDPEKIRKIQSMGARFLRKGETPLRTVLNMMRSRLTGIAYSTERDGNKYRW